MSGDRRVSVGDLLEACVKVGYMNRETGKKNWRLRYAVLVPDALYLFANPTAEWVKRAVPLGRGTELYDLEKGPGLLRGFFFSISPRCTSAQRKSALFCGAEGTEFHFSCETKADKYSWMNAIGLCLAGKVDAAMAYGHKGKAHAVQPSAPAPAPAAAALPPLPSAPRPLAASSPSRRPMRPPPRTPPSAPPPPPPPPGAAGQRPQQQQQAAPRLPDRRGRRSMSAVGFDELCGGNEDAQTTLLDARAQPRQPAAAAARPPQRAVPQAPQQQPQQHPRDEASSPLSCSAPPRRAPPPPLPRSRPVPRDDGDAGRSPRQQVRQQAEYEKHHAAAESVRRPSGILGWIGRSVSSLTGRKPSSQTQQQQQQQRSREQEQEQQAGRWENCAFCGNAIVMERDRILIEGHIVAHAECFTCTGCHKMLDPVAKDYKVLNGAYYCIPHYNLVLAHQADADREETEFQESVRQQQQQQESGAAARGGHWRINWNRKQWMQQQRPST